MITMYTAPSCTSCRKARAWMHAQHLVFQEKNLIAQPLSEAEIKHIMSLTEDGTEELISTRSQAFRDLHIQLDDMTTSALIRLIQRHPNILRRPIIVDEKRLQIGYTEEEIRRFLPREVRALELQQAQLLSGF